jgi:hypothetical protein
LFPRAGIPSPAFLETLLPCRSARGGFGAASQCRNIPTELKAKDVRPGKAKSDLLSYQHTVQREAQQVLF